MFALPTPLKATTLHEIWSDSAEFVTPQRENDALRRSLGHSAGHQRWSFIGHLIFKLVARLMVSPVAIMIAVNMLAVAFNFPLCEDGESEQ